jgi:hypothetical protein
MTPGGRAAALRRIAHDLMAEPGAAFRPEPALFQDFGVRCRLRRLPGGRVALPDVRLLLAEARTGLDPDMVDSHPDWALALERARRVPEDLQAIFLILAAAALLKAPCPSDAEVSQRCGHHSAGRARSRIGHLEKSDLVVVGTDAAGRRTVALPQFGWSSAPGEAAPARTAVPRRLGIAAE